MYVYVVNNNTLNFIFDVPLNQYLALGFGPDMSNVDMFVMQAYPSGPIVQDLFSTREVTPSIDAQNDYTYTTNTNSTHVRFNVSRKFETGESKDYVVKLVFIV